MTSSPLHAAFERYTQSTLKSSKIEFKNPPLVKMCGAAMLVYHFCEYTNMAGRPKLQSHNYAKTLITKDWIYYKFH